MTVEDRLRATSAAIADTMRPVRPLTLPPEPPRAPAKLDGSRPAWRATLVPLTAALAVLAVAATLVAGKYLNTARPSSPVIAPSGTEAIAASVPRYYVELSVTASSSGQRPAIVGDSRTGKELAQVAPPAHREFTGVTGAADNRTFVIDAIPALPSKQGTHAWYLLLIAPGTTHPARLSRLPVPGLPGTYLIQGIALSPDGRTLAVMYQPVTAGSDARGPVTLRTYSLRTGKTLRMWTTPDTGKGGMTISPNRDNLNDMNWTSDGRTLAFVFPPYTWPDYERTLDIAIKSSDLLAASRQVLAMPGARHSCSSLLLASDGRTMVCGPVGNAISGCVQQEPEFDLYSTATGRLIRVLYRYRGDCSGGIAGLLWAGSGGTAIGLIQADHNTKNGVATDFAVGLLTPGKFTPLPVHLPDGYGFITGTFAF
jgi:hypothetical protein